MSISRRETILLSLAMISLVASAVMAMCLGMVFPIHWTTEGYVAESTDLNETYRECQCTVYKCKNGSFSGNRTLKVSKRHASNIFRYGKSVTNYPFLAAVIVPRYSDSTEEKILACTASIISERYILTGSNCLKEAREWKFLQVRVGSEYWSRGGMLYDTKSLINYKTNGPMVVEMSIPIEKYLRLKPISFARVSWLIALAIGWKPLERNGGNRKDSPLNRDLWMKYPCSNCTEFRTVEYCMDASSWPVVIKDVLLGFRCGDSESPSMLEIRGNDFGEKVNMATPEFIKWSGGNWGVYAINIFPAPIRTNNVVSHVYNF